MKIIQPQDLRAADLPGLESPFFALEKARRFIQNNPNTNLERLLGQPATYGLGARAFNQQRNTHIENVLREIRDGRLLLVFDTIDGEPSSPVVRWREEVGGEGRWQVTDAGVDHEIIAGVNALNQHGITPGDLRVQGSMGVGSLPSGDFAMEYRLKQREQASRQDVQSGGSPSSSSNNVLPVSALTKTTESSTTEAPPEIHLEIGIFTDGTLNNAENSRELEERAATECVEAFERGDMSLEECEYRLSLAMGGSYSNAPSNVAKLARHYIESSEESNGRAIHRLLIYAPGIGTKTGEGDSLVGSVSGMGETGIVSQVRNAFFRVVRRIYGLGLSSNIRRLTVDLFGFSRGAASARLAAHEILEGPTGALGRMFQSFDMEWPGKVAVRFVGVFDTVAAVINPLAMDLSPSNERNAPVTVYLDPKKVEAAAHLIAADEHRENFSLNSLRNSDGSLPENFREISLPGVHSDIGGGYSDNQREDVLVTPYYVIPTHRHRWPEQTMEWDNLNNLKLKFESEGWIGEYSMPVQSSEEPDPAPSQLGPLGDAYYQVHKKVSAHPAPDGRVELALRMVRQVRGEYSRIAFKVMWELASQAGVPLRDIRADEETRIPDDLMQVSEDILHQVISGCDSPSLTLGQQALIRQRYVHYSANYNALRFMIGETVTNIRFGRNFSPNAPASSGERAIHANR
ncbi:T6SS phospholipase effector Tle1-like catalytic domain-containing protein [Marinobacter nauticus]|uniref:T6SS phospholipase effector Tle1-like catalytic domain-containing protein n=1 Tax=Marinobacter nauticus TaxID=2743 RepID=UPI001C55FEBB|nr:DUF2235 domain-containing protein [Marinobacter nauticus]MBW3198779.1 DUF2235 domain-containing protein [Marinobacter nauticus]MBY6184189.1 DUF2235 domain-containing protein [Marinobacter nauticus]